MKKEIIRREFLKLKLDGYSYAECAAIMADRYEARFSIRTLKRWFKRFNQGSWNLRDLSTRPDKVYYSFYAEDIEQIILLRKLYGYSAYQLKIILEREKGISMSESMLKGIIRQAGLSRGTKMQGTRLKWVRFERSMPNSLWQLDGTEHNGSWILPVIDDCSRYCLGISIMQNMTTANVTSFLEQLFEMHGKPRELLTDNGPEFGGRSKDSEFDKWCRKQGIKHIRSGIHKPTTVGKISRLQATIVYELPYCYDDLEYFRWRYNCHRPHRSLNGLTPNQVYFGWKRHKKYKLD